MCDTRTRPSGQSRARIVELNVGGHHYTTSLYTLRADPASMLAVMFRDGQMPTDIDENGRVFIDRDGTHFGVILNYLRDRQTPAGVTPDARRALQAEARFYQVAGLEDWAMKVEDEMKEAEAAAVDIAGTTAERITANLDSHFDTVRGLLQQINVVEWMRQARALYGDGMKDLAVRSLARLRRTILACLALCLAIAAFPALAAACRKSGLMSINVDGHLITASRSTLSGDRHTARIAETPYADQNTFLTGDFIFTGRFYCFAHELYAPRWPFLASRRCEFQREEWTMKGITSLQSSGRLMGPAEFHAISRCWCGMKQNAPERDDQGRIFVERDPDMVRDVVRALRSPGKTVRALHHQESALDPAITAYGRASFCKEVEYFGIVDFIAACSDARPWNFDNHSASALLAHDMLELALKGLKRFKRPVVTIPLEQVVLNRLHNNLLPHDGVRKQLDNPIDESRKHLQAFLEDLFFALGTLAIFAGISCTALLACRSTYRTLGVQYLRVLLSPFLGPVVLVLWLLESCYFKDWDPDDLAGWFCRLPQRCAVNKWEDVLYELGLPEAQERYESEVLRQSHACDRALAFAWHGQHVYRCLRVPMLLISSGNVFNRLCRFRAAFADERPICSAIDGLVKCFALGLPFFLTWRVFTEEDYDIFSLDERVIFVTRPWDLLDAFLKYADELRLSWVKAVSARALAQLYGRRP